MRPPDKLLDVSQDSAQEINSAQTMSIVILESSQKKALSTYL